MTLNELKQGEKGIITKVRGRGAFRKRITEMGFVKGKEVTVIKHAPLKDPVEFSIMGYNVSLRRSEANLIDIITDKEISTDSLNGFAVSSSYDEIAQKAAEKGKTISVALVGNPNSGKTTLFNYASNSKEHVGNYSGVTVDAKEAKFKQNGYTFEIADLPGTYSISAYTPEELYVRKYITDNLPDVVINIIDSSNLERNLYLTTQLIDLDIKVVVALNMYDELEAKGAKFDYKSLGRMLGIPFIPTVAAKGKGIKELFDKVIGVYEDNAENIRHIHINYGFYIEDAIIAIQKEIKQNRSLTDMYSSRYLTIKLLEKDKDVENILTGASNFEHIKAISAKEIGKLEKTFGEDCETIIADAKYAFIAGALKETYKAGQIKKKNFSEKIDNILTGKITGFPVFILFLSLMFFTTFSLGNYPKEWIEQLVDIFRGFIEKIMLPGTLNDLITDGIINGVGGVIVFLPNILILFLFISFMEDTGYMARVAFIMDRIMHKIGLHGKSFIPMMMGFGCTVPAIMATRTIENRNDRLLTMLITPFMSCSARLPVYVLLISAFFPKYPALMLLMIYFSGVVLAVIFGIFFKKTMFKSKEAPFVMELPPYRLPTLRSTLKHMWNRASQYLKKIGGVILLASIIIWALEYYPKNVNYTKDFDSEINAKSFALINNDISDSIEIRKVNAEINHLKTSKEAEHVEKSYIGIIGKAIEPVLKPLGFDWKMGISLLTGIAGKEVVVSTLAILYQTDNNTDEHSGTLQYKLQNEKYTSGSKKGENIFNPLVAFAFLIFILIYFPCVAVIAVVKKESGKWKWAVFVAIYTTVVAWLISFLVYQIGSLLI